MKKISSIDDAEDYIFNYDFFSSLNENKELLLETLKTCEQMAIQYNNDRLLCRTRTYILYLYIEENNLNKASEIAVINLKFAKEKKMDDELLAVISIIAHLYQLTGNYSASEELIAIATDQLPNIKEDRKIAKIYLMIAEQYALTSNREKCINAFRQSISHALKTDDLSLIAICYNNYAANLLTYNLLVDVPEVLEKGMKYAQDSGNRAIEVQLNEKYGCYYSLVSDHNNAIIYLSETLHYYISINDSIKEMNACLDLARVYINTANYEEAFKLLTDLKRKAMDSDANKILAETYLLFVTYYEDNQNYREALLSLKKYNEINALIYSKESDEKIKNLQIQHKVKTMQMERDNATKLARIKHDFLADMSHEIRTPINSILGIGYLLQQDVLTDKQKDYILRLNHSGEQLLGIINDVLDISKIEAGKFHLVSNIFPLRDVIRDIYDNLSIKAADKNLELILAIDKNVPAHCIGDPTRLGQILVNVIYNAIKFTSKGYIKMEVTASVKERTAVVNFVIEDTGIGMNEEQMEKIFTKYEQAESNTQIKFGGTGLGLSITKKLIELMNGTIGVKSKENVGSKFSFQILFSIPDSATAPLPAEIASCENLSDKLIYIADDVEENRKIMAELLFSLNPGIRTDMAENGKELLELIKKKIPDLIMMDLDMPGLNGFEAVSFIRKNYTGHSIRTIACTASLLTMPREELLQCGFDGLLLKPYTIRQLSEVLI
jgi:signal transduction histidine kinase/CheY-like chemotaxis protein